MIIRAKHNFLVIEFLKRYINWKIKKKFKTINIVSEFVPEDLPVLIITNHISWWDGFWTLIINQRILKKKPHFMMLEEQLRRYWLLNYIGGFSIRKNSRSLVESINHICEILNDKNNAVLMFPQGKIHSMHNQDFKFERGIEIILKRVNSPVQLVFMAAFVDYFSNEKPSLTLYVSNFKGPDFLTETMQSEYNLFYKSCIEKQEKMAI